MEPQWENHNIDIPLVILESSNSSLIEPLMTYVDGMRHSRQTRFVTIVLPGLITLKWWQRYRHLDSFGHKCILDVQVPRVELPDGSVLMFAPVWPASRCGLKLRCEALSEDNISGLRQTGQRKAA
jgi:hypothetical protein